jgi:hypothetical protein
LATVGLIPLQEGTNTMITSADNGTSVGKVGSL